MLAKLRELVQGLRSPEESEAEQQEILPTWDVVPAAGKDDIPQETTDAPPLATPVSDALVDGEFREPVEEASSAPSALPAIDDAPATTAVAETESLETPSSQEVQPAPEAPPVSTAQQVCPYCQAPRTDGQAYCDSCGWIFPKEEAAAPARRVVPAVRLKSRYELGRRIEDRDHITRWKALDHGAGGSAVSVILVRETLPEAPVAATSVEDIPEPAQEQDPEQTIANQAASSAATAATEPFPFGPAWPGVAWERELLRKADHPVLPQIIDSFREENQEYLVEEQPTGRSLWDAWDDPNSGAAERFGWLRQLAEALDALHRHGAVLEGLRPDIVVITSEGRPRITDLTHLLPLPLPANAPIRATCYSAPELILNSEKVDARADLYSFGAMLYALHLGRELTELDFELHGVPKSILTRFPDIHPDFGRLVGKTLCRDPDARFPTEEAAHEDPSGFKELIRVLDLCGRRLDSVRLEIGAWTTTGMIRTGNEDAFALFQSARSHENNLQDSALVLLADGMGGYEAGEVAAGMALHTMRTYLSAREPFAGLVGGAPDQTAAGEAAQAADMERCKEELTAALKEANHQVYSAAQSGTGRRQMGCTAEAVFVDARNLIVGHVGDSRTYHFQRGELVQLTQDQTWVSRMVDIGALSPAEAAEHPRQSELYQAIGGNPEVEPAIHHRPLRPGDWVVVCSDGLSNHVAPATLKEFLLKGHSAESVARRLVNFANFQGAMDNVTVVVIRAT